MSAANQRHRPHSKESRWGPLASKRSSFKSPSGEAALPHLLKQQQQWEANVIINSILQGFWVTRGSSIAHNPPAYTALKFKDANLQKSKLKRKAALAAFSNLSPTLEPQSIWAPVSHSTWFPFYRQPWLASPRPEPRSLSWIQKEQ